jgi:hypothetical protein
MKMAHLLAIAVAGSGFIVGSVAMFGPHAAAKPAVMAFLDSGPMCCGPKRS